MTDISKDAVDALIEYTLNENVFSDEKQELTAQVLRALRAAPTGHWKDACRESNGPEICDEPCSKCLRAIGEPRNG